jgi:hypothetical protein
MNQADRKLIVAKNNKAQEFIQQQHRLPKKDRDCKALEVARDKARRFKRWLDEK